MDDAYWVLLLTLWGMFLHLKKSRDTEIQMRKGGLLIMRLLEDRKPSVLASFPASTNSVLRMRNLSTKRLCSQIAEHHTSNQQVQNRTWRPWLLLLL